MKALEKYNLNVNEQEVTKAVKAIVEKSKSMKSLDTLKLLFSLIDLTSLNGSDTKSKIADMAVKVSFFQKTFPDMPNVAAICVYPALVPVVKKNLTIDGIGIAAVGAGFPASQTFFDIKTLECKRCVVEGATEVDTVISVGEFFEENYEYLFREIDAQKDSIEDAHLKVILESGSLRSMTEIRTASLIALEAGADFIKTSTGKTEPAATPEAVYIMCQAIKEYMKTNNRKAGIKPAGGISTSDDALIYYAIVKEVLGDEWLNNTWFRLGASRLANNLLIEIATLEKGKDTTVNYF